MDSQKKKIVLIDDHEVIRAGLSSVINAEHDMSIVDQSPDAQSGLASILSHSPDVAVVDINMPGSSTFQMTSQALASRPNLKVIFLTAHDTDSNVERALQSGASGFITKSESLSTIVIAIREILGGKSHYFSDNILQRVIHSPRFMNGKPAPDGLGNPAFSARKSLLSQREEEVLCCVAKGQSAKQIAVTLKISAKTVERHKSNIMLKLQLHTQVELTRYAIREGMITA